MGSKIDEQSDEAEKAVRETRRVTRRHFSAENKVRIVIAGLGAEDIAAGSEMAMLYKFSSCGPPAGESGTISLSN